MIDFFPLFSRDAANTVYGAALRATGVPHRIFAGHISFSYRSRLELVLVCLPRLAWFALRSAWASLRCSPAPDAVVVSSDIEALIFAAIRGRRDTRIVISPFIFTARGGRAMAALHHAYYRAVLGVVDIAIVHARIEVDRYRALFPGAATRFVFVPYGLNIDGRAEIIADAARARAGATGLVVVAAGKSGRDYATLFAAMRGLDAETRVICDRRAMVPPVTAETRITVLGDCHDGDYARELAEADIVVVPLAVADISAGQMVIIQAMALGRAVIVTDTPTTRDYLDDGVDALLVPRGDPAALRAAIDHLAGDPALRARLGAAAMARYEARHGTYPFMAHLVAAIEHD